MNIIIIVHNQRDSFVDWIERAEQLNVDLKNVIVVDNYSDDGLEELLRESALNYIICDEKEEAYSGICNTVIKEFGLVGSVYVTSPNHALSFDTLDRLEASLSADGHLAAISPARISAEAIMGAGFKARECFESYEINPMCVMYNLDIYEKLQGLNEQLFLPHSAIEEYVFRVFTSGYVCAEQECPLKTGYQDNDIYPGDNCRDREVLRKIWNMNYFGTHPNMNLISMIREDSEKSMNILEIGCDCGANLLGIRRFYKNANLYGVEINESAARIASNVCNLKYGNIEEQNISFNGIKFDYIIFGDVLEHLHAPDKAVSYCKKLLKRDGRIVASIPNLANYQVIRALLNGDFPYADSGLLDRTHIHFFTYNEIIRLFSGVGLQIDNMQSFNNTCDKRDEQFVDELLRISPQAERHFFTTFQYLVSAVYTGGDDER